MQNVTDAISAEIDFIVSLLAARIRETAADQGRLHLIWAPQREVVDLKKRQSATCPSQRKVRPDTGRSDIQMPVILFIVLVRLQFPEASAFSGGDCFGCFLKMCWKPVSRRK